MKKTAIVTGVTGQDGSYLSELLLEKDYKVYGLIRRSSSGDLGCSSHLKNKVDFSEIDLTDLSSITRICKLARADEFYNLAAQSHVGTSFNQPVLTSQINAVGVLNCLEAIRESGYHTRFYQASTSEMYGGIYGEVKMNESSQFHPRSPYGVSKLYGYWMTVNYRESYKMFTCNGILFNHESPRRGQNFVTRKITTGIRDIVGGKIKKIRLGNINSKRDWGHARDYVKGMWMMLNHSKPDDYILATGETHSIKEFLDIAFKRAGLGSYEDYVEIDPQFYRPAEVDVLIGDATKAKSQLGWQPDYKFIDLVHDMVDSDLKNK